MTLLDDNNDSDVEDHIINDTLTVGQVSQVTGSVEKLGLAFGPIPYLIMFTFQESDS